MKYGRLLPEHPTEVKESSVRNLPEPSQPRSSNPLGRAGSVVSFLGCICCTSTLLAVMALGESYAPMDMQEHDPSTQALAKGINVLGEGLNILGQAFVFLVGGLVGSTLSAVGIVLCAVSLRKGKNVVTIIALLAGFVGPGLLAIKLMSVF